MLRKIARNRPLTAWVAYEFSLGPFSAFFLTLLFPNYLETLIGDPKLTDKYWGLTNSITLAVVAVTTLIIGGMLDRKGFRRGFFRYAGITWLVFAALALTTHRPLFALILFGIALLHYQWVNVPYNAYLNDLSVKEDRGRVSATGWAAGYLGSLILLLAALPLLKGSGDAARGMWLALWIIPISGLLFFLPAAFLLPRVPAKPAEGVPIWGLLKIRPLLFFLIASALYMDGITTIIEFAGRFAKVTIGMSQTELIGLFVILQIFAAAGALLMGQLSDHWGDRPALLSALALWVVVLCGLSQISTRLPFFIACAGAGVGMGMAGSGSRAFLSRLIPVGRETEGYGLFAITSRFGAIFGPALFGMVSARYNQHMAVLTLLPFFIAGGVLLWLMPRSGMPAPEPKSAA